jgi:hypothetical protein
VSLDFESKPYQLPERVLSRSISFENPTGEPGAGGRAASPLGVGRKGRPARFIQAGEEVLLADIAGNGTIRHIWMTMTATPRALRGVVIRAYWDGQRHASIESPVGDFFGFAHGLATNYSSAAHSVGDKAGMNIWLPMPFTIRARITITNDLDEPIPLFYQIDYTSGDNHGSDVGPLHVLFRRENPTTPQKDFELLPRRFGRGRYVGAVIGVKPLAPHWWGEGEVKIFLDGNADYPTIAGTGSEDYVGHSFGVQRNAAPFNGVNYKQCDSDLETGRVSMYRWHLRDPILWYKEVRVTIQQIGFHSATLPVSIAEYLGGLYERADDWSAASFWYELLPSDPLPQMPEVEARIADLPESAAAEGESS